MKFTRTTLPGVWILDLERREDARGFFARTYCEAEFKEHGLVTRWPQCNLTLTRARGTIRGLHWQSDPHPEVKLIRCTAGGVYDVVVDIRRGSATFGKWEGFELTAESRSTLYVPAGFAHGFQSLADNSEMFYHMSESYYAELARGVRCNDPRLNIAWPLAVATISDRDRTLPLLEDIR